MSPMFVCFRPALIMWRSMSQWRQGWNPSPGSRPSPGCGTGLLLQHRYMESASNEPQTDHSSLAARSLVITPTYNEAENIEDFVESLLAEIPGAHVLIVDDNSPDGTGRIADVLAQKNSSVFVLHRGSKQGLGTAYLEGFAWGLARAYDFFFVMDADGSHLPRHLPLFFAELAKGTDLVIGSRNVPGGSIVGWGPFRFMLSKGGSFYARTILGLGVRDLTSGYKAFRRDCLEKLALSSVTSAGYAFQIELTYRAAQAQCAIAEVL